MTPKYKEFLTKELPTQLKNLEGEQAPDFGIMTAHHMVEHLIYVTKSSPKKIGEPEKELNKSQRFFRRFVDAGAPFEYRPKDGATLNDLRTASIAEAVQILERATERFYTLFESTPDHKSYNPMMGEFNLAELELFLYQHGRWHLHQFGLIEKFSALTK